MQSNILLEKYKEIIAEEVNVKQVNQLDSSVMVTVTYVPLGQKIGGVFGKDTSVVIAAAKAGQAILEPDGQLLVFSGEQTWQLSPDMYEIRYSGLEEDHQTVEGGVIVSLDFTLTPELIQEGVAREMSRFLNQMRKDAQFSLDEKVVCIYATQSDYLHSIVQQFVPMLQEEALLSTCTRDEQIDLSGATSFISEQGSVSFILVHP